MNKTKIVCVALIAAAVLATALFNIFWQDRPTVSERENRALATFPEFSAESLIDGSYFSGIDSYVSDNFIGREFLVDVSQKMKSIRGISSVSSDSDEDVVFIPSKTSQQSFSEEQENEDGIITDTDVSPQTPDTEEPDVSENDNTKAEQPEANSAQTEEPVTESAEKTPAENPTQRPKDYDPIAYGNVPVSKGDKADENISESSKAENTEKTEEEKPENAGETSLSTEEETPSSEENATPQQEETQTVSEEPKEETSANTAPAPSEQASPAPSSENTKTVETETDSDKAEFLADGYIIYRNAVYSIPYLVKSTAQKYGVAVNHYADLFKNSRVTILVAPLSSGMIDQENIRKRITDQNSMIETINSYCGDNINKVNIYPTLYEHRDEYIYFRSDHHWTALGAYYAYAEFAKSVGLEPTPIEKMEKKLLNSSWRGTAYSMTNDERAKAFSDELYAYLPTKKNEMTIYEADGSVTKYNGCVRTTWRGYSAFIGGDNPYTIITVPENPADMTVLVLKDSYGCAFVPFLCENYRTIIVADPRHVNFDLYELLKDYPLKDIIFMTNIFNPNVASWVRNVNRIVGN